MKRRYVLAPEAALDLVDIWHYLQNRATVQVADRVEATIKEKSRFWLGSPEPGTSGPI